MIYLMRHGQDDENYIGGWSDVPLIEEGIVEVNENALWIKENLKIKKIVASDIKRARNTAEIVNNYLKVSIKFTSELREQSKGKLNGMLKEQAEEKYPKYFYDVTCDTVYPEGESLRDLYERMKVYINKLLKTDDDTLIITHRGVINMIYYLLNNKELDMDKKQFNVETASVHELDKVNKKIKRVR